MLLSFIYLVFVSLLKLLIGGRRPAQVKDLELIILRHQLEVLRRQVNAQDCEWLNETPGVTIDLAAEVAPSLAELPAEPAALETLRGSVAV